MIPKFRAWEPDTKFMNDQVRVTSNRFGDGEVLVEATDAFGWVEVQPEYLMQSTGLKDKNGVEIFEGDVVEWLGHRGVVEFVLNNQQTMIIGAPGYITDLDYSTDFNTEVIGNIHENPKILGQADES